MWNPLYRIFLISEFILVPVVFSALLRVPAPYGRHFHFGWGKTLNPQLAWFLMELPAVWVIPVILWSLPFRINALTWIYVAIWEIHYLQRTFVFPLLLRDSKRDFPLGVVAMAFGFNVVNGYVNGYFLGQGRGDSGPEAFFSIHFIAGGILFLFGLILNISSDQVIRSLRSGKDRTGYQIPNKGWFKWVTNPHYLGEIMEWCGWAILTWSLAGLAFALFSAANLVPRAIHNHNWYKRTFSDYPEKRKILIPHLFTFLIFFCIR